MKYLASLMILTLALTAFAENNPHESNPHESNRDNSSLFPQPKADAAKATAPKIPELLEPGFQAVVGSEAATLKWKESEGATVYHVQVATDPNFKWLAADDHFVKGSSYDVKGLEKGRLYFWRVAAWKDGNMASTNKSAFAASSFETR